MDSISQAALGAAIGEVLLGKRIDGKGAILGAVIATLPDLDVIFYLFYDSYKMLSIHRGFSHSLLFTFIAAFLIAYLLSKIKWCRDVNYKRLWVFVWLTLITHVLLDAFTTYGTQLFLPFSDLRVSFDSINVVDPVYTIPLLLGLMLSLFVFKNKPGRSKATQWGLVISTGYLLLTLFVKKNVNQVFIDNLDRQNINHQTLLTVPVGIANLNWYGVAKTNDIIFIQKYSLLGNKKLQFESFPINENLLEFIDPEIANKMRWFAKGFYTVEQVGDKLRIFNLQVDMRGMMINEKGKAPTLGYFEISKTNGKVDFSSGSLNI